MGCGITSLLAGLFDVKHYLHLQVSLALSTIFLLIHSLAGPTFVATSPSRFTAIVLSTRMTIPEVDSFSIGDSPSITLHSQTQAIFSLHNWFYTMWEYKLNANLGVSSLQCVPPVQCSRDLTTGSSMQSFALVSTILAITLEFLSLLLFQRVGLNNIAMGPSALIFAMLYQYSRIVPSAYNFRMFGVPLTNKSLVYLLALQVRSEVL